MEIKDSGSTKLRWVVRRARHDVHMNVRAILRLSEHDGVHLLNSWDDMSKRSRQHTLQLAEGFDFLNR